MRTIWAVNQFTISHPVSIWYDQVQKMHQGKLILILTRLSTIVRHFVQHVTPHLAGALRERDAKGRQPIGVSDDNKVIAPALDVQVTLQYGRYCIENKIKSLQIENTFPWVGISRGLCRYVTLLSEENTNSTSTSTIPPTVPEKSNTGQPVATHELSVCEMCHRYMSVGLTYCYCGRILPRANEVA